MANVTGITLSPASLRLHTSDKFQLNATIQPSNATNKNVTWSTSNSNVAMVTSSGVVDAGALGTATITARAAGNTTFSRTCAVTVVATTTNVPNQMTADGFGGWYNRPSDASTGLTNPIPRFVHRGWGPCVAYSIMMGDYYLRYRTSQPNAATFFNNNVRTYLDSGGATGTAMDLINRLTYTMSTLRTQLNAGRPVVISGQSSSGTNHLGLAVAYRNGGTSTNDFFVIDPYYEAPFLTTLGEFKLRFPNNATNISGATNPMLTFK